MNTRTKAMLAVIAGNSIFGLSFLFSKTALELALPSVMLAVRFSVAFLVLNLIVLIGKNKISFSLKGKPLKYVIALSLVQPVIYFMAESYGIALTSSAFAGTIIAVIPIAGLIADVVIMHVNVTKKQIVCSVASVIGVIITTVGAGDMKSSLLGVMLLLVAVIAGALFYVFSKKAGTYFNPLEKTYVMFGVGSIVYLILGYWQTIDYYDKADFPCLKVPEFWVCILYLAVVSSVIAFLLLNYGSSYVSVSEASLFANLTTVISIVAGIVIVHEEFSSAQIVGAVIIISSVYFATIKKEEVEDEI